MVIIPRLGENAKHLNIEAVNPELFSAKLIASLSGRTILTEGKIVPSRMAKVYSQNQVNSVYHSIEVVHNEVVSDIGLI